MKSINNTLVIEQAIAVKKQHPHWRGGQCVFNSLYQLYPSIANNIRGTKHDMFHDMTSLERREYYYQKLAYINEELI